MKQEVGIQPVIAAKPISRVLSFIMALELHEGSGTNEARPVPVFSEIMVYVWKLNVIKYGSKALNRSKMVVILNYLLLIWTEQGLIGLKKL